MRGVAHFFPRSRHRAGGEARKTFQNISGAGWSKFAGGADLGADQGERVARNAPQQGAIVAARIRAFPSLSRGLTGKGIAEEAGSPGGLREPGNC